MYHSVFLLDQRKITCFLTAVNLDSWRPVPTAEHWMPLLNQTQACSNARCLSVSMLRLVKIIHLRGHSGAVCHITRQLQFHHP